MEDLRNLLQEKYDWVSTTTGAKNVQVKLTCDQLALLVRLLEPVEAAAALPKIEPRMLSPMEPRGTNRTPQEVAQRLAELYGQTPEMRKNIVSVLA